MNYYKQDENTSRIWGALAMLLYFVGVVCVLLFVSFTFEKTTPEDEGILINFGVSESGYGVKDLAATDVAAPAQETPRVEDTTEELITDPNSDVEIPTPAPTQRPTPDAPEPEPERTVNQRALFPGRTEGSTATSQGDSPTPTSGNQGDESGTPDGSAAGSGEGLTGVAYNLTGRSIVGALPKPAYNENSSGKVVIDVVVNDLGEVTGANYRAQGSTTNNSELVRAARAAALKARFSQSEAMVQGGTITYIFKMN